MHQKNMGTQVAALKHEFDSSVRAVSVFMYDGYFIRMRVCVCIYILEVSGAPKWEGMGRC